MTNYITADIKRIFHKRCFLGAAGLFFGIFAVFVFIYYNPAFTADMYVAKITSYLSFFPLIVGLFVFMSVYADDFKCKSMQVAIGFGISRKKIVMAKLVESVALLLTVGLITGILSVVTPTVLGITMNSTQTLSLVLTAAVEILRTLGYIALSCVPVFFSQNAVNGIICYVLFSTKSVYIALSMILGQDIILHTLGDLTKYLYSVQLYNAKTILVENGRFEMRIIVSLFVYVIMPAVISAAGFHKKELEF